MGCLKEVSEGNAEQQEVFISESWKNHNITMLASSSKLWGTEQKEAIDYGNFIHEILAKIKTIKDIESVFRNLERQTELSEEVVAQLKDKILKVVNHSTLKEYFSDDAIVYNERELVYNGEIIIPDRLIFKGNEVVIVDYKTGEQSNNYKKQITNYSNILENLGFRVQKKFLIYLSENVFVDVVH